jgi:hypothetical protein
MKVHFKCVFCTIMRVFTRISSTDLQASRRGIETWLSVLPYNGIHGVYTVKDMVPFHHASRVERSPFPEGSHSDVRQSSGRSRGKSLR